MKRKVAYFFAPLLLGLALTSPMSFVPTATGQGNPCPYGQLGACLASCPTCEGKHGVQLRICQNQRAQCQANCNANCQPPGQTE
jgi:hypothetical protein